MLAIIRTREKVNGGTSAYFVITVNPAKRDHPELIAHEYEHVKQWWAWTVPAFILLAWFNPVFAPFSVFIHGLLYRFVALYRQWCEVQAFRKQLSIRPEILDFCADLLMNNYGLKLTKYQALELLR